MKKNIILIIILVCVFSSVGLGAIKVKAVCSSYEGYILLDVQRHGEAYYIFQGKKYYLGRPDDAFVIMRRLSLGISENNFQNGFKQVNDIWQIFRVVNPALYPYIAGRIILRTQAHGEAYYVEPGIAAGNGYSAEYLGRPYDSFRIMTKYGAGTPSSIIDAITNGTL